VIRAVDNISVLLALTILLNGIQPVLSGMSFELPQLLQACNAKRNDFLTLLYFQGSLLVQGGKHWLLM
jgi:hypothetical protein